MIGMEETKMLHSIQFWFYQRRLRKNRQKVLNAVKKYPNGTNLQSIAVECGFEIRKTQAILTLLKKNGLVESFYENNSKIWRIVNGTI